MKFSNVLISSVLTVVCVNATAGDLGTKGNIYPIQENDALEDIYNKLKKMEQSGELAKKQQEAISRAMNTAKNPAPVESIGKVTTKKVHMFDPTLILKENISTDEGQIIAPAGTRINPLESITLSKTLVFFDGRDPDQVEAVKKILDTYKQKIKPVLVGGSWYELTKQWKRQVYFDQYGYLSKRFEITAVPAVVRQKGKFLEISETPVQELK